MTFDLMKKSISLKFNFVNIYPFWKKKKANTKKL